MVPRSRSSMKRLDDGPHYPKGTASQDYAGLRLTREAARSYEIFKLEKT